MSDTPQSSNDSLADRLRWTWADHGSGYDSDYTADLMAAADELDEYEQLRRRVAELERGEYTCQRCGTRKDADASGVANEF